MPNPIFTMNDPADRRGQPLVDIANRLRKSHPFWSAKQVICAAKAEWTKQWNQRNESSTPYPGSQQLSDSDRG